MPTLDDVLPDEDDPAVPELVNVIEMRAEVRLHMSASLDGT